MVVLKVLERGLDASINFILEHLYHTSMKSETFCSFAVPLTKHFVVGLFLLETHLHKHSHLLVLHIRLLALPTTFRHRRVGLIKIHFFLLLENFALFLLFSTHIPPQLLNVSLQLTAILFLPVIFFLSLFFLLLSILFLTYWNVCEYGFVYLWEDECCFLDNGK